MNSIPSNFVFYAVKAVFLLTFNNIIQKNPRKVRRFFLVIFMSVRIVVPFRPAFRPAFRPV